MINLSTQPADIIKELSEDYPKAIYWAKNKDNDSIEWAKERRHANIQSPEVRMGPDYTSPNNNRWLIFYLVQPVGRTNQNAVSVVAFCYYETIGSIGAFCLVNGDHLKRQFQVNGCCIYASHFFRRLSERSGVPYRSKEMLMEFVTKLDRFTALFDVDELMGPGEVVINLAGGQGRGVILSRHPVVYEIRTFIPEEIYSKKQQAADNLLKPSHKSDKADVVEMLVSHCRVLMDELGYVPSRDIDFWRRCMACCVVDFMEASRLWNRDSMVDCQKTYMDLLQGIAMKMGIAHFDPMKAKSLIYRHLSIPEVGLPQFTHVPSLLDWNRRK